MRFFSAHFFLQCSAALVPLSTSGSKLIGSDGREVIYSGVNWPGHLDAMIPEGLQYLSVEQIVWKIKDLGMNVIRLTYATEMVEDHLAGRGDAKAGFIRVLGDKSGSDIWRKISERNGWQDGMTRLQVNSPIHSNISRGSLLYRI